MKDHVADLYSALVNGGYNVDDLGGSIDGFREAMSDPVMRKEFYDWVGRRGNFRLPDYDVYESALASTYDGLKSEVSPEEAKENADSINSFLENRHVIMQPQAQDTFQLESEQQKRDREAVAQRMEDQAEAVRRRLQEDGTIDRMKESKKEARRDKLRAFGSMLGSTPQMTSFGVSSNVFDSTDEQLADVGQALDAGTEYRQNKLLQEKLDVALDMARAGENQDGLRGVENLGLGLWDSATRLSTWDFGASDIVNNLTLQQIVEKWENDPSSLTATEQKVLDGIGMATAVQELYSDQVGIGYNVGQSLPESASFMMGMALNPASGLGKSLARNAVRTYGRNSIAKNLARIGGDIAETAIMTATTGAGRVAADALERINGSSTYEIGENGIIIYGGQKDQETVGNAVIKAIGANFIENYSEALGEYFDPLLGMSRKVAAGGLRKMNLNKWADALSDVQPSQMTASIRALREKTKFGGIFGEIMEEEIGMALNTLFVGDNQWSDFTDLETQLTTVLSCAIMSGTLNGVEQVSSVAARRRMEKNAKNAEQSAANAFGEQFAELRESIDQASPEGMVDVLRDVYMSQGYSLEQKRKLAEYAAARLQMQYYNAADAKARREVNKTQQGVLDAYEAGRHAQLPTYYNIEQEYRNSEEAINASENAENIWAAIETLNRAPLEEHDMIINDFTEEEQQLIRQYRYNAARVLGAVNSRAEQAEDLIDEYRGQIAPFTKPDGTVTTAILGDNVVFVMEQNENGDAVVYTNDGRKIFAKTRDLEHVEIHNAEALIERFRQSTNEAMDIETENAFEHHPKTQAPQVGLQLQSPEGEVVITAVNDNMVEIVPAVYKDGQVQPKEGSEPRTITVDDAYAWQDSYYQGLDDAAAATASQPTVNNMSAETTKNEGTPTERIEQSVSEEVTDDQNAEIQPTETESVAPIAPAAPQTARERVPKDKNGNPIYEQTDADTAWDAIVEETEGDTEMAQRVAADMLEDKKAALEKLQKGKPKKGATVAEKIANEKAHQAAIAQAQNDVVQWEAIVGTEARRREAAMSEADRYAAEMEQKSISEKLKALGEPQSLEEYVLGQLAGGAYKLRWSDKENGTKGFGSHTGLSTEEMKARLSMIDNKNGLTPEEIAHSIVENMDASFGEVDVMDVTNMVIDAVATNASRRAMLNGMVESRAELLRQQEIAEQEAKDAWYMEQYHATEEELAAYNEWLAEEVQINVADEAEYERRIITFAEQLADEYDNERTNASLLRAATAGEGNGSVVEGSSSVGEEERTDNTGEVLGNVEGRAEQDNDTADQGVLAQSDDRQARIGRATREYWDNVDNSPETEAAAERDWQEYQRDLAEDAAETVETLENGDVRRTNLNSNGEIATVAIERDGNVISVDTYEDGALFERTDYDANGNATKVTRYKDGEVVSEQEYKDGKRKVTANVFEMAEEAQKKRKSKKKSNDKLAEKNRQQKENRSETRGVGNRPQLQDASSYESFVERVEEYLQRSYQGTELSEEVAQIIRDFNKGKTIIARTEQEKALLEMLRVMTNKDVEWLLSELQTKRDSLTDEERKAYDDAVTLVGRYRGRGEHNAVVRALTGANLREKLPLTKIDELFDKYNSDADVAELYRRVRTIAEQIGLDFWFDDNMVDVQAGGFRGADNRVRFNAHMLYSPFVSDQTKASVMVHEILHAVADYAIETQETIKLGLTPKVKLSKQVLNAANTILNIYEKAVKNNPLLVHEEYDNVSGEMKVVPDYGTDSAREMLMEISNPEFRDKLKQIEYNGRSVWQRIWDAIKSMFTQSSDVTNPTAYDSMAKALDVLINEFSVDAYRKYSGLEESAMKLSSVENLRFREGDNQDAAYMDAVERGDMETAQRMVNEAARKAMKKTKVVDKDKQPMLMSHHTDAEGFYVFDRGKIGTGQGQAFLGAGFNFSRGSGSSVYGSRNIQAYLDARKPLRSDRNTLSIYQIEQIIKELNAISGDNIEYNFADNISRAARAISDYGGDLDTYASLCTAYSGETRDVLEVFEKLGFDSTIEYGDDKRIMNAVVFNSHQIKSADPVTYDDNGNVIPLSERFNLKEEDIRFRDGGRFFQGLSNDEIFEALNEHTQYYGGGPSRLMQALEEYYKGEIVSASHNAGIAMSEGLVPVPDKKYAGIEEEYHHIEFRGEDGETFVEAVPFVKAEDVEKIYGIQFREGMGAISDREVSYENDPIAKWQGKPRYYGKRAAAFAERERARMQKGVEEAAKILGIEVEIITDASALKGRKAKAKGWYDINSKKVVVVVPNHVSKGDAVRTVLHEGVAHHGLRELFGDGFDAMLDNVYNNVAPELKARIDAIAERTGVSTQVATEEYLASLAETTNFEEAQRRGWWAKIKQYFVKMLDKLGMPGLNLKEELTDNELRYLLWRSYQNLVGPNSYLKPLGYIDDVAKQKELKVGEYAEKKQAASIAAEMSEAEEWAEVTMQRIDELEAQAAQLENEIAEMEAKREADDASRYDMWEGLMMPLRMQLEDVYAEIEGLYTLSGEEEVDEEEREAEKQRQLYQKRIDNAYLKAVREGDWEEATDLFRQYVLSKAEDEGIVPMDYGVGYRGGAHSSIAKKVKEENPDAIAEAAYQMSIRIPKGSILVPMPSRTGNATYTVKLAEAIAKATDSEVRDVLKGKARMSVYEAKQKGIKMTPEDLGMYTTEELPKGKNIVIIDNVIDKGTTALAAVSAVKGASVVAYAYTLGDKQRVATLKLAEPVTYDDNKRIIPLSRRFDKETDDIRYRTSEEIEAEVERESAALGVPVRIARSVDELPDEDTRKRAVDGKLKGYYDPRTNEVVLYAPNTDDANDAKRTILHEIVGHKGLRQLIGEQRYDKAMVQLMYMLPSEVRDAVLRRAERHGWNAAIAMDEYLAEQAERDVQPTWWGKVNAMIRALLRNMGFDVKLTDADVTYLLWRSRKKLQGDTAFDMATDAILKQAARKSAEAEAWNEQAFKDAEMRDFEKGAMQSLRYRIGDAQNEYDSTMKSMAFKQRESWQDSMRSLKVFMDILEKESGKKIADFENAYMYENAMSSANLMEMQMFRHDVYGRLLKAIHELMESGAKYEDVVDYMMAKHGLERNEKMARKRAEKEAEGDAAKEAELYAKYREEDLSGLTALTGVDNVADAEVAAMQMVADFEAAHNTDLLWNETRACTQTILNISHDAGILSDEVYGELWNQYEYYIPLRGFDETTAEEMYTYVGDNKSPYNAPIKTAKGRKSKADDPIATIATMAESAIVEANRNRLKQRFLYMVERHRTELASVSSVWVEKDPITGDCVARFANIPNDATPEEAAQAQKAFEERMEQLHEQEPERYYKAIEKPNIPYRVEKKANEHEHQVIVKRNGKDVVITINGDPRVAQAINGQTNPEAVEGFSKFAGNVNRFLSANFTTRNPAFVVSNFVRDGFYTNSMVWVKEGPAYARRYNQNWVKATKLLPSLVSKYKKYESGDKSALDMSDPVERAFYEFMIHGGETGYTVINSVEDYKGIVSGDLRVMQGGVVGNAKKAMQTVGNAVDTFGRWAEDTSRFAAYLTSRQMGRTITKSIWDAKEISVNFNKKGSGRKMTQHDKGLNSLLGWMSQQGRNLYVFWNAGVQGLTNFSKAAKEHPGKMAGLVGAYFGLGMLVAAAFGGQDDDDDYWNLPEYVRRNNICHRVGDKWITLPLPIEIRAIYGMGELAMSWMAGKEDPKKIGMKIVRQVSQVLPIDMMAEGGGLKAFIPSWFKPIAEVYMNTDWTGMPIYRERTSFNEYDPTWMLAFKSTSPEYVAVSRAINEATNDNLPSGKENKYDRGWADSDYFNNPAAWEHVVEGYLGGLATTFNQTKKSVMALWNKDLREVRNIPVISRFVKSTPENEKNALRNDYFEAKDEVDKLRAQRGRFRKESKNIDNSLTEEQLKDVIDSLTEMEEMSNTTISKWDELEKSRKSLEQILKEDPEKKITIEGKEWKVSDLLDGVTRDMIALIEAYRID